ncbi:hypothetical protein BFJ66_g17559 [Fusarium oxysporum f. sp. cepae]|nr:hypothetical protein BFJ67_g17453 [Fusarium oxysporum f. sp. cepae]RKK21477.1 hypothetical protein BFJ66_g17559 [Fusarium oxysporum f. sp. cepae]
MRYFTLALFLVGSASARCWDPMAGDDVCSGYPGKQGVYCNDYNTAPGGGPIYPAGRTNCEITGSAIIGNENRFSYCCSPK